MYSEKDIQEIRNRINIVDLVSQYTNLKRSGRSLRGLCPFHTEKTPSFYVDPEKQLYHCFGCGAGGDIFDFVMEVEKLNFTEAVELLAEKAGVTLTRVSGPSRTTDKDLVLKCLERASELFRIYLLNSQEGKEALKYLNGRNIGISLVKEFEIGLAPSAQNLITKKLLSEGYKEKHLIQSGLSVRTLRGLVDRFRGRIMFPIRDIKDKVVGFGGRQFLSGEPKYLNTPETPFFKKGSLLYNLNKAKKYIVEADRALIVEGYTDVIAFHRAGLPYVVATLGTALTENHLAMISRFTSNIYLAFDSDSAGLKAAESGINLIPKAGRFNVKVIVLPEGKDPAEFVDSYGEERARKELVKLMDGAENVEDFVIKRRLSGFNLVDPKEKRRAAEEVSAIIGLIDDPIVKEEYIQRYAKMLSVTEDTLRRKLKSYVWYNSKQGGSGSSAPPVENSKTLNDVEKHFLKLLYRDYGPRATKTIKYLKPEHFFDDKIRLAFELIFAEPERYSDPRLLVERIRSLHGDEAVRSLSAVFVERGEGSNEDERVFEEMISYLRERFIKRKISELKLEILDAESRGDFEVAQKLLLEVQRLAASLKNRDA